MFPKRPKQLPTLTSSLIEISRISPSAIRKATEAAKPKHQPKFRLPVSCEHWEKASYLYHVVGVRFQRMRHH